MRDSLSGGLFSGHIQPFCFQSFGMNQHDRSAQCKRIGHSLILGAPIRKVGGIDGQHHARLFDDPLIGQKLGVRLLMEVDAVQFRASRRILMISAAYSPTPGSQATRNSVTPRWRSSMIRCAISSFMRRQPSSSSSKPHGNRRGC